MNKLTRFAVFGALITLGGCGAIGNTGAIKDANKLAIACDIDGALLALDRAQADGGLSGYLSELERIAFLREAGRDADAQAALEAYLARPDSKDQDRAELEKSLNDAVTELRKERLQETGSAECP